MTANLVIRKNNTHLVIYITDVPRYQRAASMPRASVAALCVPLRLLASSQAWKKRAATIEDDLGHKGTDCQPLFSKKATPRHSCQAKTATARYSRQAIIITTSMNRCNGATTSIIHCNSVSTAMDRCNIDSYESLLEQWVGQWVSTTMLLQR